MNDEILKIAHTAYCKLNPNIPMNFEEFEDLRLRKEIDVENIINNIQVIIGKDLLIDNDINIYNELFQKELNEIEKLNKMIVDITDNINKKITVYESIFRWNDK